MKRGLRRLATVRRWSIIPTIQTQSTAEHSFFVAIYADWIASMVRYEGSRELLFGAALLHDLEDIVTGDPPSPVNECIAPSSKEILRRRAFEMSGIQQPDAGEGAKWIIKMADLFEMSMFLAEETRLGNQDVWPLMEVTKAKAHSHMDLAPFALDLVREAGKQLAACIEHAKSQPIELI